MLILSLWAGVSQAPAVAQVSDPGVRAAATDGGPPVPLPGLIAVELQAIAAEASPGSEANQVVPGFFALSAQDQPDLLNFLRSL